MTPERYKLYSRNCGFLDNDFYLNCTHSEGTFCMLDLCPLIKELDHKGDNSQTLEWLEKLEEKSIRCRSCNKLLGKVKAVYGEIEIKCPKCKKINAYNIEALEAQSI